MTEREERILELAREAWQNGLPSDLEVEAGARRIQRRMRSKSRSRSLRRPVMAVAFAVALGGALAYAASGGTARWFGQTDDRAQPARLGGAVRAGEIAPPPATRKTETVASPVQEDAAESLAPSSSTSSPAASSAATSGTGAGTGTDTATAAKRGAPAPAASWRAVDEALDARDDAKAKQALEGLAKSDDATTRAKARLGLAQLARGRGDCNEARRIAFEVAAMRGVEPSVIKRAQAIVLECR